MSQAKPGRRSPSDVDRYVGARLRELRAKRGMSQTDAGDVLGVTVQQIQKYEKGTNRVSARNLFTISRALNVPVSYFFKGLVDVGIEDGDFVNGGIVEGHERYAKRPWPHLVVSHVETGS